MQKLPRIIYNDDSCSLGVVEPPHTIQTVNRVLDYMEHSQIDRLCWCMFGGWASMNWYSSRVENGFELAEKHHSSGLRLNAMYSLYQQGVDYIPRLIERCHRQARDFYASIRMNDCHLRSAPNGPMAPQFWRRNQDKRLWGIRKSLARRYRSNCRFNDRASVPSTAERSRYSSAKTVYGLNIAFAFIIVCF